MKFPITNLHTIALLKILQKFPIAIKGRSQLLIRAYQDFWSSLSFCLLPHLPIHYTALQLYWITYSNLHKPCLLSLLGVCLGFSLSKKSGYLVFILWYQQRHIFLQEVFSSRGKIILTSEARFYWRSHDIALSRPFVCSFSGDHRLPGGGKYAFILPLTKYLLLCT